MKEKIDKIVKEGYWEFAKLLKLKEICQELADEMYSKLSTEEILEMVWESKVDADNTFGQVIRIECRRLLQEEFMNSFQRSFETATVKFDSPSEERLTQESITEELPPLPKAKEDKPLKTFKSDDGTDMPKGVKRV